MDYRVDSFFSLIFLGTPLCVCPISTCKTLKQDLHAYKVVCNELRCYLLRSTIWCCKHAFGFLGFTPPSYDDAINLWSAFFSQAMKGLIYANIIANSVNYTKITKSCMEPLTISFMHSCLHTNSASYSQEIRWTRNCLLVWAFSAPIFWHEPYTHRACYQYSIWFEMKRLASAVCFGQSSQPFKNGQSFESLPLQTKSPERTFKSIYI